MTSNTGARAVQEMRIIRYHRKTTIGQDTNKCNQFFQIAAFHYIKYIITLKNQQESDFI